MVRISSLFCIFLMSIFVSACHKTGHYAPVTDATIEPLPQSGSYRVQMDDTLYSIAWRYGLDYRYLAKVNNIARPYHIEPGQAIYLRQAPFSTHQKIFANAFIHNEKKLTPIEKEPTATVSQWHWPAKGPLIGKFTSLNKGINIGGYSNAPIYATAAGKIVYSGNGLRAYGNLIIIKHNSVFLSAYAHNNKVLVKEGQWVKSGQKIAEMGDIGARRVMLHFEIRRNGKPVNPLAYLDKKRSII